MGVRPCAGTIASHIPCVSSRSHPLPARSTSTSAAFRASSPSCSPLRTALSWRHSCASAARLGGCRQRRSLTPCSSAISSVSSAVAALWSTDGLFVLSTLYCIPLCVLILVAPKVRAATDILRSDLVFVPLALAYFVLLVRSWTPDTFSLMMPGSLADGFAGGRMQVQFIPKLQGICSLFGRVPTAASLWVHLLAINMFAARWIVFDGLRRRVATWHSTLVAAVCGPLGLCCHFLTQIFFVRGSAAA